MGRLIRRLAIVLAPIIIKKIFNKNKSGKK